MKKLGVWFYIVLLALTLSVLGMLGAWLWTRSDLFLYIMIGLFPVYLFYLIFSIAQNGRAEKNREEARSSFLLLARSDGAELCYITYLGNEKRVKKPSHRRKDYLVEFYRRGADVEILKKHLWFDLPESEEAKLDPYLIGSAEIPYPLLADIKGKDILIQAEFYRAAENLPLFEKFFKANDFVLYGE